MKNETDGKLSLRKNENRSMLKTDIDNKKEYYKKAYAHYKKYQNRVIDLSMMGEMTMKQQVRIYTLADIIYTSMAEIECEFRKLEKK